MELRLSLRWRRDLLWLLWLVTLTGVTLFMLDARTGLNQAHVVLVYLLVVLGGSATVGWGLALTLSLSAFLLINYFFQLPYDTITVAKTPDWMVLFAFLIAAVVASVLLERARAEAARARRNAEEIVRLSAEAEHAAALREADRLKDALLASVSHELRTPLTTIKMLAYQISERGVEQGHTIRLQADRLNHLVADLLDLSLLNSGNLPVSAEVNTADELLGAVLEETADLVEGREVLTAAGLDEPVLVGRFDFVHSLHVLRNLVENAAKYSPPDTPIEIAIHREPGMLAFSVCDRGPGIPEAEVARIFEPFYRRPDAPPDAGGLGLGLSLARRLAEAQGGEVRYTPRPGGGSRFTLLLPAA